MANQVSLEQLTKVLEGVKYPATKQDLISHAQQSGATDDVLQVLQGLPDTLISSTSQLTTTLTDTLNKVLPINLKDTVDKLL